MGVVNLPGCSGDCYTDGRSSLPGVVYIGADSNTSNESSSDTLYTPAASRCPENNGGLVERGRVKVYLKTIKTGPNSISLEVENFLCTIWKTG